MSDHWARTDWIARRLLAAGDAFSLLVGMAVVAGTVGSRMLVAVITLPFWLLLWKAYGLYDGEVKRISSSTLEEVPDLFHAVLLGCLLEYVAFRVLPVTPMVAPDVVLLGVVALPVAILARVAARSWCHRFRRERALLVGDELSSSMLVRKLTAHPEYGIDPMPPIPPELALEQLRDPVTGASVRRLIVWAGCMGKAELTELMRAAQGLNIKVSIVPETLDLIGPQTQVDHIEGITVLGLNPPVLPRTSRALKRGMDLLGAGVVLVLTSPLLAVIAVAVKLDSPGPVLFRQRRIGRAREAFRVVKFRTMVSDAEALRAGLLAASTDPNWLKLEHDPRITRVGRALRSSSLDELPQVWNVLRGDMSLVGPRPLIESEDDLVEEWHRARLDLTPGVTGLWQVLGRTNIPFVEMVKLDYSYVTNWSLWVDVKILLRTIPAVLSRRGVN